jgi:hypothetical protein
VATQQILQTIGTPIIFADSVYSPGTNTILGTRTDDIDCASLAAAAARQSVKADLGMPHAAEYNVVMTVEIAVDPAANGTVDLYWSESHSATAAVGNMGGASGADGAYTGYAGMTLAESLRHLTYIGSFVLGVQNDLDGVNIGPVGRFAPVQRYGCLIVFNNCSQAFHSDSVEFAVRFTSVIPDLQAAA